MLLGPRLAPLPKLQLRELELRFRSILLRQPHLRRPAHVQGKSERALPIEQGDPFSIHTVLRGPSRRGTLYVDIKFKVPS